MQQTEKYQFDLIEGSDLFLPDALNENMEKVEGVLAEHRAEASGALAELTASTAARFAALTRVEFYPYVGTGTTTRTFTFEEQPQAVIFASTNFASHTILFRHSSIFYPVGFMNNSSYRGKATWQGNSLRLGPGGSDTIYSSAIFNYTDGNYLLIAMYGNARDDFMPTE